MKIGNRYYWICKYCKKVFSCDGACLKRLNKLLIRFDGELDICYCPKCFTKYLGSDHKCKVQEEDDPTIKFLLKLRGAKL